MSKRRSNKAKWSTKAKCINNMMQGAIARGDLSRVSELKLNKELSELTASELNGGVVHKEFFMKALHQGCANTYVANHKCNHRDYVPPSKHWLMWKIKPSQ